MPFNNQSGRFERVWNFVDQRETGDDITRTDLDVMANDLANGITDVAALHLQYVGEWNPEIASFPASRPNGGRILARDAFVATAGGTVGGVTFDIGETLVALVPDPGQTYAARWLRLPFLSLPAMMSVADAAQGYADRVDLGALDAAVVATGLDRTATAADRLQTGLDAAAAALSASQAALYDGPRRVTVQQLLLDTALTYTGGSPSTVAPGDSVRVDLPGFAYRVAASGATDHHVTTAGGVKLYVQPGADGQYHLPAWGVAFGAAGNIAAVSSYLAARATVLDLPVIERNVPTPKLHLVSEMANGKNFQGFPSAVRHNGSDFIIYREGVGHTEATPFGTKARLVCAVRNVNGIAPTGRTVIYAPTGIDPRDPNILRDDFGNAILVGGKLKVIIFEWAGDYTAGSASAKVFDLDPANLAAGLVNPVTIPLPVQAVKSDVRLLDNGEFAFIGYSINSTCYLVTTTDWATFATEVIGPGNEAAFCQTQDGALIVIVRAEESFGAATTVFYKKPLGGSWHIHDVLPHTLNAPTLVKGQGIRVISAYPEGNDGWLLLARDKTGRTALTNVVAPIGELVAFRSKQSFGQTITRFTDRVVIAGQALGGVAGSGDGHYCSAISSGFGGQIDIYTYSEFRTNLDNASTSFTIAVWRIEALADGDQGIRVIMPRRQNYVCNGDFTQGEAGYDLTNIDAALVADSTTGRSVLRLSNSITSPAPSFIVRCRAGETLFAKLRLRVNATNLSSGRHLKIAIYDYSSGSAVLIQIETPELDPLDFDPIWRTVLMRPFVTPSSILMIAITSEAGITAAETDIAGIDISDDYSSDMMVPDRLLPVVVTATVSFTVSPTGGAKASGTYSSLGFWAAMMGLKRLVSGIPFPAVAAADISLQLTNCTTQSGALKCLCTSAVVGSDGLVTAHFAVAPGESGTMSGAVTCLATATIRVPQ